MAVTDSTSDPSHHQALCAEMAFSFQAMGHTLPPWRQADSILS